MFLLPWGESLQPRPRWLNPLEEYTDVYRTANVELCRMAAGQQFGERKRRYKHILLNNREKVVRSTAKLL